MPKKDLEKAREQECDRCGAGIETLLELDERIGERFQAISAVFERDEAWDEYNIGLRRGIEIGVGLARDICMMSMNAHQGNKSLPTLASKNPYNGEL